METFWSEFGHWASLVLIAGGSGALIYGLARTSHANGGRMLRVANKVVAVYNKVTRKPVQMFSATASLGATATLSASIAVAHGPQEQGLNDSQKIDRLFEIISTIEKNFNAQHAAAAKEAEEQRAAVRGLRNQLDSEVASIRAELKTGIRRVALDGLGWAAGGAIAIGIGDVIGAFLALGP